MKSTADLTGLFDGRHYRSIDIVKLNACGCKGCSACCHKMKENIVLDPYVIWRMQTKANLYFDLLLAGHVRLSMVDGLVLPVLAMTGGLEEACTFLNNEGRCSIYDARPGICRVFPLGRRYEDGDFRYFLQIKECRKAKDKIHVRKWMIDPSEFFRYEDYLHSWYAFTEQLRQLLKTADDTSQKAASDAPQKAASVYVLQAFYSLPWDEEQSFYEQYEARLANAKAHFRLLDQPEY